MLSSTPDSGPMQRRKGLAGGRGDRTIGQLFAAELAHCVGSDVAVLAGLCLSLLDQAYALSESVATWIVTRREMCLFCHMHTQTASSAFFINNSSCSLVGGGKGTGAVGRQQYRDHAREEAGRPRSPASTSWPSNTARWPRGPCLGEWKPGTCSGGTECPSLLLLPACS